mgnify:CR=1 FL=1|tara:strand:- start:309 stop:1055 length:747 start_codon:yes stop_codon:yes gene_type:complete
MADNTISLKLEIPEYLTIQKYCDMNSYKGSSKFGKLVNAVSVLTGQPLASVRDWDVNSLTKVSNLYANIADHKELFHPVIEWNGKLYGYSSIKKCSLGEYIDLEDYCKDMENNMHKVAAILYRPIKSHRFEDIVFNLKQGIKTAVNKVTNVFDWYTVEKYDSNKRELIEEEFKDFPVHLFLGGLSFFLSCGNLYLNRIAYLKGEMTEKEMTMKSNWILENPLAPTGDGSGVFTNSLSPTYYQSQERRP